MNDVQYSFELELGGARSLCLGRIEQFRQFVFQRWGFGCFLILRGLSITKPIRALTSDLGSI